MSVLTLVIDFTASCGRDIPRARQSTQPPLHFDHKIVHSGKEGQDGFLIKAAMCPGTSCHSYQFLTARTFPLTVNTDTAIPITHRFEVRVCPPQIEVLYAKVYTQLYTSSSLLLRIFHFFFLEPSL